MIFQSTCQLSVRPTLAFVGGLVFFLRVFSQYFLLRSRRASSSPEAQLLFFFEVHRSSSGTWSAPLRSILFPKTLLLLSLSVSVSCYSSSCLSFLENFFVLFLTLEKGGILSLDESPVKPTRGREGGLNFGGGSDGEAKKFLLRSRYQGGG